MDIYREKVRVGVSFTLWNEYQGIVEYEKIGHVNESVILGLWDKHG